MASMRTRAGGGGFLFVLGGLEALMLVWLGWGGLAFPLPATAAFLGAFACYVGLIAWSRTADGTTRTIVGIWALGVLLRLIFLPLEPRLSDDVYRYLWDGHVQRAGINPFLYAPAHEAVAHLRTPWHALINNPTVPTIYPPIAQLVFRWVGWISSSIIALKIVWVACDLVSAWLLGRIARATGRNPLPVWVAFLAAPLLVVESAWSAHLESLGILGLAFVIWWSLGASPFRTGMALGAAALVKLAPLAALPALVRRYGPAVGVGALAVVAVGYLPFLAGGRAVWEGLLTYAEHWRFNEGAYLVLERAFESPLAPRFAAAALVLAVVGWTAARRFTAERALFWIFGAGVALSPTVHPWYVLWLLPFVALRSSLAWLWLSGFVFLAYWGLDDFQRSGQWTFPPTVRLLIWIPFAALLVRDLLRPQVAESEPGEPAVSGSEEHQEG